MDVCDWEDSVTAFQCVSGFLAGSRSALRCMLIITGLSDAGTPET